MKKLTIVIADDEQLSLKSEEMLLKKNFPNLDIVGMAENGIELKNMLESLQPDMAIVDIRMPGLTGLEVIELLKNRGCKTHFIVNTAYSDFAYVKAALDMKTDGYLLKPVKQKESIEVIEKMCQTVEKEKKENEKKKEMQSAFQAAIPTFESELLLSVFSEHPAEEDFQSYCKYNDIDFKCGCVMTILTKSANEMSDIKKLNTILTELLYGICRFFSTITEECIVIMLMVPREIEEERISDWCEEIGQLISSRVNRETHTNDRYGMGKVYDTLTRMKLSYQESLLEFTDTQRWEVQESYQDKINRYTCLAKEFIKNHFNEDIALADCAEKVKISPYYLSHIFKEVTGMTFVKYLSIVRMEEAKKLCRDPAIPIKEIVERCGYNNVAYFYRVFKKATGQTIGEYRKQL